MLILGVILVLIASLVPSLDANGKRAMIVIGIILMVLGAFFLVFPGVLPLRVY